MNRIKKPKARKETAIKKQVTAVAGTVPRHQRPSRLQKFLFGVPYYPEHWTAQERMGDARLMAKAGVNTVRMAEFAWDAIEPSPGRFNFALFDETISALGQQGIATILCTPTATPPRWLTARNPDWMRVDSSGRQMKHGSRQHCCTNNEGFRAESRRITGVMADWFARNPHVIGWQTDNELFCHISECYCAACLKAFRQWLKAKYHDIGELNRAWGAQFWAQTYDDFEQIPFPYIPERPTHVNPHQTLDYYRFISDGVAAFQREQVEILRAAQPGWWVTHNGLYNHIDYWKFARDLDFLGVDIYPGFAMRAPCDAVIWAELAQRCRAASGSFIVPEQQGGAGGQRPYLHETPRPGQMRLWAYQAIAHGADGLLHFRWRTCRFGAEMYWNGILDHDNIPRRRYDEFSREGHELRRIGGKIPGTVAYVKAAVLVDQDQEEAHATMGLGLPTPRDQRIIAYKELWKRHLPAGLVDAADDLAGLDLVVLPSFALIDEVLASKLESFVKRGGTLVATARSATRDRRNHVLSQTPPGPLATVFGATVEEFGVLTNLKMQLKTDGRSSVPAPAYEILRPRKARPAAFWGPAADGGPHAAHGHPGVTINNYGAGRAVYVGTFFTDANIKPLFDMILKQAAVAPLAQADEGVEAVCRFNGKRRLLFLLNHNPVPADVTLPVAGTDILTARKCTGKVRLPAFDVAVIEYVAKG